MVFVVVDRVFNVLRRGASSNLNYEIKNRVIRVISDEFFVNSVIVAWGVMLVVVLISISSSYSI